MADALAADNRIFAEQDELTIVESILLMVALFAKNRVDIVLIMFFTRKAFLHTDNIGILVGQIERDAVASYSVDGVVCCAAPASGVVGYDL